jgi:ComF family protein
VLQILHVLFDIVFPPRETEVQIRSLSAQTVSTLYTPQKYNAVRYLLEYQHPTVQALIKENKFHQNKRAAELLAHILDTYIRKAEQGKLVFVPIPLGTKRMRTRGYNQVTEILKHVGEAHIEEHILTRSRNTTPQTELKKAERLKNMEGVFTVNIALLRTYENTTFILVDDVITTGATLQAARDMLAPHLHPTSTLICAALAH